MQPGFNAFNAFNGSRDFLISKYHRALIRLQNYENPTRVALYMNFFRNFGILFLVPYTKDFGKITQF